MARPGFNCSSWFDFKYEEGVLMGLMGQYSSGSVPIEKLYEHIEVYCPKVIPFYGLSDDELKQAHSKLTTTKGLKQILNEVRSNTKIIKDFDVTDARINIEYCGSRLDDEISFLKSQGINSIVSLTEDHHNASELGEHFDLHHFSVEDLNAPSVSQAEELAMLVKNNRDKNSKMAVHCLAGIGRTSTMLMAAHVLNGENFDDLKQDLARKNPYYKFSGRQAEFLDKVVEHSKN